MKQVANGNYVWLVLVIFLIMPMIHAFTKKTAVEPWQTATEVMPQPTKKGGH